MSARHADYSLQIQEKAIEALNFINPEELKPNDLIKWLDIAVKIERLSRGVSTENIKQESEFKEVRNDAITKENLERPEIRRKANNSLEQLQIARAAPMGLALLANNYSYQIPKHINLLNEKLQEIAFGDTKRLMVFLPPRHGKSMLVSHYFPAWYLGMFPDKRVILTAYEADFAATWGTKS